MSKVDWSAERVYVVDDSTPYSDDYKFYATAEEAVAEAKYQWFRLDYRTRAKDDDTHIILAGYVTRKNFKEPDDPGCSTSSWGDWDGSIEELVWDSRSFQYAYTNEEIADLLYRWRYTPATILKAKRDYDLTDEQVSEVLEFWARDYDFSEEEQNENAGF